VSFGQLCDDNYILDKDTIKVFKEKTLILTGTRNPRDGLWDIPLKPKHLQITQPSVHKLNVIFRKHKTKQGISKSSSCVLFQPDSIYFYSNNPKRKLHNMARIRSNINRTPFILDNCNSKRTSRSRTKQKQHLHQSVMKHNKISTHSNEKQTIFVPSSTNLIPRQQRTRISQADSLTNLPEETSTSS